MTSDSTKTKAQLLAELQSARERIAELEAAARSGGGERLLTGRESLVNAVLDSLPVGIAVNSVDPGVHFSYMNDAFPVLYGVTREALAEPDAFWEAVYENPEFRARIKSRILADCASGDPERMVWEEVPIERKGTAIRYVTARNIPVPDKGLMVSMVWDVTERMLAQLDLVRSEERFRSLFDNAVFGIALHDLVLDADGLPADYVITDVNPAYSSILGIDRSRVVGRRAGESYGTGQAPYLDKYAAVALGGKPEFFESYFEPMGRHFQISVYSHRPGSFVTVFQDVTEARHAQQEIARIFALSKDMICAADINELRFTRVNPAFKDTLGYDESELLSKRFLDFVHPDDVEATLAVAEDELRSGTAVISFENRYRCKDGSYRWLNWVSNPLPDMGVTYAVARDVTEKKRVERELIQARDRAERASRAKSEFLATMSHEIRTPLHGVMGMLNLIVSTELGGEQRMYVDHALRSSRNLMRILSDILDISRIESGTMEIVTEPFALDAILAPVIGAYEDGARDKGLDLGLTVSPEARGRYIGDPGRIRQVLYNLMGNAVKYTDSGSVGLKVLASGDSERGARLEFKVFDTGVGIPEDKLDSVFEAFTQVDSSYRRKFGGTGLGLAIVKKLVRLMGGSLSVTSEPGMGTEIVLGLTLERAESGPASAMASTAVDFPLEGHGERILVAEDDRVNQLAIKVHLTKLGFNCHCVADGRQALEALARESFSMVLMDIQMPELDGVEATRRIRSDDSGRFDPRIPIVALTAHAMKGDREQFLEAGMDDYLAKPVNMDELARAIRAALGGQ